MSKKSSVTAMVFGILSICCCYPGILGLVFAIVSKNLTKKAVAEVGENGFNKAAKITSTIGLIFSIIGTVTFVIVLIVAAVAGTASLYNL